MTVDPRCLIATDLGVLKDGSGLSEDHVQGLGLVTYRGTWTFDGVLTPSRGRVIQLAYARPQYGASGLLTRFHPRIHVISSSADPFVHGGGGETTIEVGCQLELMRERKEPVVYRAIDHPPAWWTALSSDRRAVVPPTISAQGVIEFCLDQLGIPLAAGSATSGDLLLRDEIDLSEGYVQVIDDFLRSSLLFGHMTPAGELLVQSVALTPGVGPVLKRDNLITLQPINDRAGAEQVTVEFDAVEIPSNSTAGSITVGSDEQKLRDWELETVIGPPEEYLIAFYGLRKIFGPGGLQSVEPILENRFTQRISATQRTDTLTTYKDFEWLGPEGKIQSQSIAVKRERITISSSASIGFDTDNFYYPSSGAIPRGGSEVTTYQYEITAGGPRLVRQQTDTATRAEGFSSILPNYYALYGALVREEDVGTIKIVTDYTGDEESGLTKTVTTRWESQAKTQSGSLGILALMEGVTNSTQAKEVYDSGKNQTKVSVETKINYGRRFGIQARPSAQARLRDALTGAFIDDNSLNNSGTVSSSYGQREPQTVTARYSFGGAGSDPWSSATYRLPYAPDDTISAVNGASAGVVDLTLLRGNARARALEYGQLRNAMEFGHANGVAISTAAWELPSRPFAPVYIDVSGLSTAFRTNGRSWEVRNGCLIVVADLMLVGTAGRLSGETPVPWMPLPADPMVLNEIGAPTGSGELIPANTITLPGGFNPAAPGGVWGSLPTTGSDTYGPSRTPSTIAPPYVQRVSILAHSRSAVTVTELLYSTTPITESITARSRSAAEVAEIIFVTIPTRTLSITALNPQAYAPAIVRPPLRTLPLTILSPALSPSDPYFSSVSLLLSMNGTNGSTTFNDLSSIGHTITVQGSAAISTAQGPGGTGSSLYLDGTGARLRIPSHSSLNLGTADCTIEWMQYCTTGINLYPTYIGNNASSYSGNAFGLNFDNLRSGKFLSSWPSGATYESPSTYSYNQWRHVKWTVESGVLRLRIDGTLIGSLSTGGAGIDLGDNGFLYIGGCGWGSTTHSAKDYIGWMRVTKGVARTDTPSPLLPFPTI